MQNVMSNLSITVRPDVLNELLKYPEVFFIREIQKRDSNVEVMSHTQF